MAKKLAKAVKQTRLFVPDELELRRWCVEQAIRWPVEGSYGAVAGYPTLPRTDVDVIGRANRLMEWVTARE